MLENKKDFLSWFDRCGREAKQTRAFQATGSASSTELRQTSHRTVCESASVTLSDSALAITSTVHALLH